MTVNKKLTTTIIKTIAEAEDVEPTELDPPLTTVIDPDALNELFRGGNSAIECLIFNYKGYEIKINGKKDVSIQKLVHKS